MADELVKKRITEYTTEVTADDLDNSDVIFVDSTQHGTRKLRLKGIRDNISSIQNEAIKSSGVSVTADNYATTITNVNNQPVNTIYAYAAGLQSNIANLPSNVALNIMHYTYKYSIATNVGQVQIAIERSGENPAMYFRTTSGTPVSWGSWVKMANNADIEAIREELDNLDIETDTTLSISGKPADANATGDEIDNLKADLKQLNDNLNEISTIDNGGNLLPVFPGKSVEASGVTITNNGDGTYTLNGTASGSKTFEMHDNTKVYATLKSSTPYYYCLKALSGTASAGAIIYLGTSQSGTKLYRSTSQLGSTYTPSADEDFVRYGINVSSGAEFTDFTVLPYFTPYADFVAGFTRNKRELDLDAIDDIYYNIDALKDGYGYFDEKLFAHGILANSSGAPYVADTKAYSIYTKAVQFASRTIDIVRLNADYNITYHTYTSAEGSSTGHTYSVKTSPFTIPEGTYFRLAIVPKVYQDTDIADITVQSKTVYFTVPSYNIDDTFTRLDKAANAGIVGRIARLYPFTCPINTILKNVSNVDVYSVAMSGIQHLSIISANTSRFYISDLFSYHPINHTSSIQIKSVDNATTFKYTSIARASADLLPTEDISLTASDGSTLSARIDWSLINRQSGSNLTADKYAISEECITRSNPNSGLYTVVPITDLYITDIQQRLYFNELFHTKVDGFYKVSVSGASYPEVIYSDRYVQFNVANTKNFTVTISFYYRNKNIGSITLTVHCNISNIPSKKYMFIGDSYTANGNIQRWFADNNPDAVTLYGTRGTTPYLNEGRSGWNINDYFTSGKGGVTNPFYNPTSQTFDFSYYMNNNPSFSDVDIVNILLGRNNAWDSTTVLPLLHDMIDSIHDFNANIIITVMCASNVASNNSGMGKYLQNVYIDMEHKQNYNLALANYFENESNVVLVWQNLNLDNIYDFATEEIDISIVDTRKMVVYSDNVHPSDIGYKKFGIAYNSLMHNILNS